LSQVMTHQPLVLDVYEVTNVGGQPVTEASLGGRHWSWDGRKPKLRYFLTLSQKVPTALGPSDYLSAIRDGCQRSAGSHKYLRSIRLASDRTHPGRTCVKYARPLVAAVEL
jgi:hypothetical protein